MKRTHGRKRSDSNVRKDTLATAGTGRGTGKREHAKTRWEAVELAPRGMEVTSGGEVVVEPEESGWISGGV